MSQASDVLAPGATLPAPARREFSNFDYIRLAAASAVIFSHSFLIADGKEDNEPFVRLLGPKNILGFYGVFAFFVISGFLITQSGRTSRSVAAYAWSRVLRIYPALICSTAFCGIVLGSIFTNLPLIDYWLRLLPLRHVMDASLMPGSRGWSIPTVAFYTDGGWLGEVVNGSLWTIPQEMACYVAVGLFFAISQLRWYVVAAFCLASVYLMVAPFPAVPELLAQFFFVAPCFAFGSLLYFWHERGKLPWWPLIVCALIAVGAAWTGKTVPLFPAYGAYPLILLATAQRFRLPSLKRFGDISYGMYLYGWPMEQVARAIVGPGAAWWQVFPLGLAGAAALGFLSWHLLEKHALRLKKWRVVFARE